nr:hypothetical protein CFP56_70045 [Quercus suber]
MSNSRTYKTYKQTTTTNRSGRRPLYAPPPTPGGHSRQHSVLGYWVPLVVTGTIAIGGLAAWIWSERNDNDDFDYHNDKPPRPPPNVSGQQAYPGPPPGQGSVPPYQGPPPSQNAGPQGMPPPVGGEAAAYYGTSSRHAEQTNTTTEDSTWFGQMRGAIRRTPSPEVFFSQASKQVSAGVAAAGAAAGAALGRIMEDDQDERFDERRERREEREGFSDHERWSEEADESEKRRIGMVETESERRADSAKASRSDDKGKGRAKRAVAVVVSADTNMDGKMDEDDLGYLTEHASILSHLPEHYDPDRTDIFVLIYTPGLTSLPPLSYRPTGTGSMLGSSYSQISTPALTPASELGNPHDDNATDFKSPSSTFTALYQQALSLVASPSQILPFTTLDGYVHILRHLAPSTVYVSDMLVGSEGETVAQLKGWVGHTVVALGDNGTGGLADTETEDDETIVDGRKREKWYERSTLVGLGKEMEVVDATRVGDDWAKRFGATPSPEVFFSQASKQVSAGVAAAGAAAGAALGRIMEDDQDERFDERRERREEREGFSDHERWSEEADESEKRRIGMVETESERRADSAKASRSDDKGKGRAKRAVAVVVSADTNMDGKMDEDDLGYLTEHASILSHLPEHYDPDRTDIFVLIYTPGLTSLPPLSYRPTGTGSMLGSSYSQISTPALTPASELGNPHDDNATDFKSPSSTFTALYQQALSLVASPSQILPFTTLDGYVHILRHLAPSTVYVSDMLVGSEGETVAQLKGWVGHTVVALGDNGTGGLADTETEDDETIVDGRKREKWYERSSLVGLGKEMEVVDATRVGDDWAKRFGAR